MTSMSPIRIEVKDQDGEWNFASYAYTEIELAELLKFTYYNSRIRVYDHGILCWEKEGEEVIDYRIN